MEEYMKRYYFIISLFALIILIFVSCEGTTEELGSTYTMTLENHSQGYTYPPGYYYEYKVATYDDRVNPLEIFNLLKKENIVVEEAWYRQYLNGCQPPGSTGITRTIYPNVLIVRLANSNKDIVNYKFVGLKLPQPIPCGYKVRRYQLVK
jgi:hypothetical protein